MCAIVAVVIVFNLSHASSNAETTDSADSTPSSLNVISSAPKLRPDVIQVESQVNTERSNAGLTPLTHNIYLTQSAQAKCDDMVARDYWSHNTPDGVRPWPLITSFYGEYHTVGENLEYGIPYAQGVVTSWMNSPEHKANILKPEYRDVGTAVCISNDYQHTGIEYIVVEHYASKF